MLNHQTFILTENRREPLKLLFLISASHYNYGKMVVVCCIPKCSFHMLKWFKLRAKMELEPSRFFFFLNVSVSVTAPLILTNAKRTMTQIATSALSILNNPNIKKKNKKKLNDLKWLQSYFQTTSWHVLIIPEDISLPCQLFPFLISALSLRQQGVKEKEIVCMVNSH